MDRYSLYTLNATSCAEEEIAPKIKEYIDKSGYSSRIAAIRLGKSQGYIQNMINQLADLTKPEKDIIKLWRETKGEKGMALCLYLTINIFDGLNRILVEFLHLVHA